MWLWFVGTWSRFLDYTTTQLLLLSSVLCRCGRSQLLAGRQETTADQWGSWEGWVEHDGIAAAPPADREGNGSLWVRDKKTVRASEECSTANSSDCKYRWKSYFFWLCRMKCKTNTMCECVHVLKQNHACAHIYFHSKFSPYWLTYHRHTLMFCFTFWFKNKRYFMLWFYFTQSSLKLNWNEISYFTFKV